MVQRGGRVWLRACALGLAVVSMLAVAGGVSASGKPSRGVPRPITRGNSVLFSKPGRYQWRVPAGVNAITFSARGAGGAGDDDAECTPGRGGRVDATFPITPGRRLVIFVGEGGHDGTSYPQARGGTGGIGGGGAGEPGDGGSAGGGGGATSASSAGQKASVVAGGGGGCAGPTSFGTGAGGNDGQPGTESDVLTSGDSGQGGQPGTSAHPGRGGWSPHGDRSGRRGHYGHGGAGGTGEQGGGGGGGGFFGGGGGGDGAGGGGGSDYVSPAGTSISIVHGANSGNGRLTITLRRGH